LDINHSVLSLTAWKTIEYWRKEFKTPLVRLIWRDGLVYFAVIFSMNLANVIIFSEVQRSLRPINLKPTDMLTVIMSCRLILNLRSMSSRGGNSSGNKSGAEAPGSQPPPLQRGTTRESPPASSRTEKEMPLLPMTIDIHQDFKPPTPPSTAHGHPGVTQYYAVHQPMPPPWQPYNPIQQYPRPPRLAGMHGSN